MDWVLVNIMLNLHKAPQFSHSEADSTQALEIKITLDQGKLMDQVLELIKCLIR